MTKTNRANVQLAPQTTLESAQYAAQQIRDAVVSGKYRPGDRLIEMELTGQLRLSRHPIREALRLLAREGFVELRPNRGAVVTEIDATSILEVYEIRSVLGQLALRHLLVAGPGPTPDDLQRLERLAANAVAFAAKNSQSEMARNDLEFQATIVEASGLRRGAVYFRELGADIERFINVLRIDYPDKEATAKREVMGLFEAIRDRDYDRADRIWHDKFMVAAQRLVALIPGADHEAMSARWHMTRGSMHMPAKTTFR